MDLYDLYQEVIVDHNRSPRNFGKPQGYNRIAEGFNPLCGDRLTLYVNVDDTGTIKDIAFEGEGCAISVASASLMTERLKGQPVSKAEALFGNFHELVTSGEKELTAEREAELGKLAALAGIREFPSRVKCATLCWHALESALKNEDPASTE